VVAGAIRITNGPIVTLFGRPLELPAVDTVTLLVKTSSTIAPMTAPTAIISPAVLNGTLPSWLNSADPGMPLPQALRALGKRYGLEANPQSIPELLERFGLRLDEPM
jgi:hypothetical protein